MLGALLLSLFLVPQEGDAQIFNRNRQQALERLGMSRDTLGPSASRDRHRDGGVDFSRPTASIDSIQVEEEVASPAIDGLEYDPSTGRYLDHSNNRYTRKSRRQLTRENNEMYRMVDSLENLILEYERLMNISDSLAGEILEVYEENENKSGAGLYYSGEYTTEVTDSLLGVYYNQNYDTSREIDFSQMDSVRFSSNVPDAVYMQRLRDINSFITLPYNQTVKNYIILYSERMNSKMSTMLSLSKYYFPIFEDILNREGMPEELKYMAVIESALNPIAVSRANAKGMWQFMYSTAKNYGLRIDSYVDERLDPVRSAEAAVQYMKDAYSIFGDWALAISSYNCGPGNVNKAIRRAGGGKSFWDIYEYLPKETRGYVPAFVGAMYAFTYYKEHGIVPEPVHLPAHADTFHINKMLHFRQISELTGTPIETIRELNSQYMHDIIPGNQHTYILRLPYQYTNSFIDNEEKIYAYRSDELFAPAILQGIERSGSSSSRGSGASASSSSSQQEKIIYRVKRGDTLSKIAARYGVTLKQLRDWNKLRDNTIRIDQKLTIYRKGASSSASGASSTSSASSSSSSSSSRSTTTASTSSSSSPSYITYTVKRGDTLSGIASRYGVKMKDIQTLNKMSGTTVKIGQKLKIPKK